MPPSAGSDRTIRNCAFRFKFKCPLKWQNLDATEHDAVRHCRACNQHVYLCRTDEETIGHAQAGRCVARELADGREPGELVVGIPSNPVPLTPAQEAARAQWARESGIDRALEDLKYAHRTCPHCHWPMPDWRHSCSVCGTVIGRR
ncbi:MAG: hypothetical protein HZA54_17405 [Planctomycetes bacterium]|nr:hypothetical protein [Planctomycetota bacterium]